MISEERIHLPLSIGVAQRIPYNSKYLRRKFNLNKF
jgi:hypothetical protein